MINEIQAVQSALTYARQFDGIRNVRRFSAQRLDNDDWGVYVEGINRKGEVASVKIRIDPDGGLTRV